MAHKWRCALCPGNPVWVQGSPATWLYHYQTVHQDKHQDEE
jgi:hypothetical protein